METLTTATDITRQLIDASQCLALAAITAEDGTIRVLALRVIMLRATLKMCHRRLPMPAPNNPAFTEREATVVKLCLEGHNDKAIAAQMRLTVKTVQVHLRNARLKGRKEPEVESINGRIE